MLSSRDLSNTGRKSRGGTRTCTECRRRKIRCIYAANSSNECNRCLERGITCLLPIPHAADDPADEKKTLRERVSKLESLIESLLREKNGEAEATGQAPDLRFQAHDEVENDDSDDGVDEAVETTRGAPFVAALEASKILSTEKQELSPDGGGRIVLHGLGKQEHSSTEDQRISDALRAALPPPEELKERLSVNGLWFDFWQQKTFGSNRRCETLVQLANRVYPLEDPIELAYLVSAYGRHNDADALSYLTVVDRLVVANDRLMGTLEGLTLIVFHAKCYLDIGQPRRAFLCNRRALSLAQIMNLHRNYAGSPHRNAVWWTIFLGDRLLSILLGLPYGIRDDHFTVTITSDIDQVGHASHSFAIHLGMAMGRVIDQVQSHNAKALSKVIDIDDELDSLASKQTREWWSCTLPMLASPATMTNLRGRLLEHAQFFLVRIYLHLPYLLKPQSSHLYQNNRLTALDSARELIRRFQALRSYVNGEPVFECQSLDFMGFMGAVVLLLGTSSTPETPSANDDMRLIENALEILRRFSTQGNNQLASQCHTTLTTLLSLFNYEGYSSHTPIPSKIFIPYFGTLYVSSNPKPHAIKPSFTDSQRSHVNNVYPGGTTAADDNGLGAFDDGEPLPTFDYQGLYNFEPSMDWIQDDLAAAFDSSGFTTTFDQDWEFFLNADAQ